MNPQDTIRLIEEQIEKATEIARSSDVEAHYRVWDKTNVRLLRLVFDESTVKLYTDLAVHRAVVVPGQGDPWASLRRHVGKKATVLMSILVEHARFAAVDPALAGQKPHSHEGSRAAHTPMPGTRVFLVHGRDDGTKQAVARFLTTLGLDPVILHERPNGGRTIIEKFEEEAEVTYAIALFTPDDVGALAAEPTALSPRARQNVVLEFGFFLGRLSRRRACALVKGTVELPSDYDGVLFVPFDEQGAWRFLLAREMMAAGMNVDLNKLS